MEGSIAVPELAAQRIRSLYATAQQVQTLCEVTTSMLKDALGVPPDWMLIENEGKMMFTSATAVDDKTIETQ